MSAMLPRRPRLTRPGLFVTATDTAVGKTVAACAIAWRLRRGGAAVGVCKPLATGCRREREGLVSEDAEALAHFADCRQPLDTINPIRYARALSPAAAAEIEDRAPDFDALVRSLEQLDDAGDYLVIEGVGGLMVPLDAARPNVTVLDLAAELGYPVAVVCRAGLGTLNHTAMTVRLLREAGCDVAGLIINGYVPDPGEPLAEAVKQADAAGASHGPPRPASRRWRGSAKGGKGATGVAADAPPPSLGADPRDLSMISNRIWLQRMNRTAILATIPALPAAAVAPHKGVIPEAVLDAVGLTYWPDVLKPPASYEL